MEHLTARQRKEDSGSGPLIWMGLALRLRLWVTGSLKSLDTQKSLMFLQWGGDESLSRSSSEKTAGGTVRVGAVGGQRWTGQRQRRGEAHRHLKSPLHTCYLIALLLTHGAGSHPIGREPTVLHPGIQSLLFGWQMFGVKSHCVQRKPLQKALALICPRYMCIMGNNRDIKSG